MNETPEPGQQPAAPLMVNIPLRADHAQLIINLLGQRPHDEVRGLIDHIANTANEQIAKANEQAMAEAVSQLPIDNASANDTGVAS